MQGTPRKFGNRLGNRKTTTGCVTCKIRRVKCDEGRPSCRRCASTGRRCDGYRDTETFVVRRVQNDSTVMGRPDLSLSGSRLSDRESHVLRFFVDQATVQLAGWSGTDFWSSLVPQLSQHYPAIQYATVALGSLLLQQQPTTTQPMATEAFALQHYGKAIQTTLSTIRDGGASDLLASVTCILFVCIEALQGHEEQAISFFRQGRVSVLQSDDTNTTVSCQVPQSYALQRSEMRTMFKRLAVQFMMFGPSNEDLAATHQAAFLVPIPILSQPFQSLLDAEDELLNLLSIVQGIALVGKKLKWGQMNNLDQLQFSTLCSRQQLIQCALSRWYTRFQELVSRSTDGTVATIQSRIGASMILQQYHIMQIWLSGSLEIDECFYDRFIQQFETIVAEANSCVELMAGSENDIGFRLDMGWIPPLYWTALKCRDPSLRRRAVSLLDVGPRQEGLWNAQLVKKVALRAIELEENGIAPGLELINESESTISMPSEENRIKAVRINLRTTLHGQKGDFAEFITFPNGQDGEWHVRREFFAV